MQDLVGFLAELHALKIDLCLKQQGIDTTTPAGKALFGMMGVFAEFERSIIQERVRAGLRRSTPRSGNASRRLCGSLAGLACGLSPSSSGSTLRLCRRSMPRWLAALSTEAAQALPRSDALIAMAVAMVAD